MVKISQLFALAMLSKVFIASSVELSEKALFACAEAGIAECLFARGTQSEEAGNLTEAKLLYQLAYENGHEPAGPALLRVIRAEKKTEAMGPDNTTMSETAMKPAAKHVEANSIHDKIASPVQETIAPLEAGVSKSLSIASTEMPTKNFRECWDATFTTEMKGLAVSTPGYGSGSPGRYTEQSQQPTNQRVTACFATYGVTGSGIFFGDKFIALRQYSDELKVLVGTYTNQDGTFTNFYFKVNTEDESRRNSENFPWGYALLQLVPNVKEFKIGIPIFELRGKAVKVESPEK